MSNSSRSEESQERNSPLSPIDEKHDEKVQFQVGVCENCLAKIERSVTRMLCHTDTTEWRKIRLAMKSCSRI